jgi:ribosome-binding protein aMBF1 (putative translation factor)
MAGKLAVGLSGAAGAEIMPKRTPQDWEPLAEELHAAGVTAEEIQAGARRLLAENRGHQLAETRKQLGLAQKDLAAALG